MSLLASRSVWTQPGTVAARHSPLPASRNFQPECRKILAFGPCCEAFGGCAGTVCAASRRSRKAAAVSSFFANTRHLFAKFLYTHATNRRGQPRGGRTKTPPLFVKAQTLCTMCQPRRSACGFKKRLTGGRACSTNMLPFTVPDVTVHSFPTGRRSFLYSVCERPISKPERHSENEKRVCARARNLPRRGCRPARLRASTTRAFVFVVEKTPARLRHKQRVGLLDY